jgi:hypothetical protein
MIEQENLKYCLNQVEKKLNWQSSQSWKESDYLKLSQIISEASNISISSHTLKRLFGKIKYKTFYNPQQATKDALSKYLGYSDWGNFVEKNEDKVIKKEEPSDVLVNKKSRKKKITVYISIVLLSVVFLIFISRNYLKQSNEKTESFTFKLMDSIGSVPFTVPVNYDFSEISTDSIFVDFDFTHPYRGQQIVTINKEGSMHNFTYQLPGYYQIVLKKKADTLSVKNVLALSDTWRSYFVTEAKLGELWMDNEIKQASDSLGYLYFSPKRLVSNGFDTSKVFYTTHRLFRQFEIDGDNFEFETRFKNSKALGGITCYDFIIRLVCENHQNHLSLMEDGCFQYSGAKFGETELSGSQENLSEFKINPENWNIVRIAVQQKQVKVYINNQLIYKGSYQQPNGRIVGYENIFKGIGMLDYIKIKDLNTKKVFLEDFD